MAEKSANQFFLRYTQKQNLFIGPFFSTDPKEKRKMVAGFLMAGVPSGSKMYRTPAITKIHAAVHLLKNLECTLYTLPTKYTRCFFYILRSIFILYSNLY